MTGPKLENGHIRIANELWEALIAIRISGEARQVFDFIIRKTWGWGKKTDKIALSQFCDSTGLKKSSVIKARKKLINMNIITVTKKVNEITPTYGIIKDYHKWKPVPKKLTEPKNKTSVTKKVNKGVPKKLPTITKIKTTNNNQIYPLDFEEFWKAYPRKKSKRIAMKAWIKINPDKELREKILLVLEDLKKSKQWQKKEGQYIPHPSTWLNADGWEDKPEPEETMRKFEFLPEEEG